VEWVSGGNRSTWRKPARAALSTTNPTWPDPGSKPGRCDGKPATDPWAAARPTIDHRVGNYLSVSSATFLLFI
jgi:hypothetical protein